jgi:hypothetical protein
LRDDSVKESVCRAKTARHGRQRISLVLIKCKMSVLGTQTRP